MPKTLTASDRSALIRVASALPKGSAERKVILAGLSSQKTAGGGHHYTAPNGDVFADTAFLNKAGRVQGVSVEHMGFGEFYANTPKGRVDFDRMRGKDFPGQSGRSHKVSGDGADWLVKEMSRGGHSDKMASTRKTSANMNLNGDWRKTYNKLYAARTEAYATLLKKVGSVFTKDKWQLDLKQSYLGQYNSGSDGARMEGALYFKDLRDEPRSMQETEDWLEDTLGFSYGLKANGQSWEIDVTES